MLEVNGRQILIEDCRVSTKNVLKKDWLGDQLDKYEGSAMVCLDVTLNNQTNQTIRNELEAVISSANFESDEYYSRSRQLVLSPGRITIKLVITIPNAKLWWTWDYGYPHLYQLRLNYMDETLSLKFGIKDLEYDKKRCFWNLNGKRLFIRGKCCFNHWTAEKLCQCIEQGMNMLRVETPYENEIMYSWCDEHGVLAWQAFPLSDYIKDEEDAIAIVSETIKKQALQITNHVSLGMWSLDLSDRQADVYFLNQVVNETLKSLAPKRWLYEEEAGSLKELTSNTDTDYLVLSPNVLNKQKVVKEQVEYLRQRKYYPVAGIYFTHDEDLEKAYTPVLVSVEPSIHPYIPGDTKSFDNDKTFTARVWVINDYQYELPDTLLVWKVFDKTVNKDIASNKLRLSLLPDSAEVPDHIVLPLEESMSGHECIILIKATTKNGTILSENTFNFFIK